MGFFFNGLIVIHARGRNNIHNFDFNCDFVIFPLHVVFFFGVFEVNMALDF